MKDNRQFIPRLVSLGLIAGCLFLYQQKALSWDQKVQENEAAIAEAEAYNQDIDAQQKQLDQDIADAQQQLERARQGLTEAEAKAAAAAEAEAAAAAQEADRREIWEDGEWTGTGEGFGGTITVTVTTSEDTITDIQVVSAPDEDEAYFAVAEGILDNILQAQSADVDTISGATFSSTGIREAVQDALSQAEVTAS